MHVDVITWEPQKVDKKHCVSDDLVIALIDKTMALTVVDDGASTVSTQDMLVINLAEVQTSEWSIHTSDLAAVKADDDLEEMHITTPNS